MSQSAERVLVTGISGFTGRYVAAELKRRGMQVHGLVRHRPDWPLANVDVLHSGHLADIAGLCNVLKAARPHRVIHLAGVSFVAHENLAEIYDTNLVGTRNLVEAMLRTPGEIVAVLLAGSANIYGNTRQGGLDETLIPAPFNDYGIAKLAAEQAAALFMDRLPTILARPFNYTGVGQSKNFIIPKIVDHARRKSPTIELGNLDIWRDFSDVRMIADAYCRLIMCDQAPGQTFNLCSGKSTSLRTVLATVAEISGHQIEVRVNPDFVRANEVRDLYGVKDRIEAAIGPLANRPLEETLRWMLEAGDD